MRRSCSPILAQYGISVCGGWFSGLLLDGEIAAEKDRIAEQMAFFKAAGAPCIVYGETARSIQGDRSKPLATKPKLSEDEIAAYARKMTAFGEWCAEPGMPLAYHHHMAAAIETEPELDLFMKHSGAGIPLLYDAGHMAFAGGDVLRVIDNHHARISHVHTKDVRMDVIDGLDRGRESFLDAVVKGAFTVPGDGSLNFEAIVKRLAGHGYEGWFVVEAEQDPEGLAAARDGEDRPHRTAARHGRGRLHRGGVTMNRMDGKICVVTGSTQGLGAAIARRLAEAGAGGIVTLGRRSANGEAVAAAITRDTRVPVRFVKADLASVEDCRAIIAAADQDFGRVDVLVNAGALTDRGTILDTSPELFDRMFATNVRGPFFLMQEAIRLMIRDGTEGAIVNIGSMSEHAGQPFISAYCASKGALATLTRNTAFAVAANRIRVNQLDIGWMSSDHERELQASELGDADWEAKASKAALWSAARSSGGRPCRELPCLRRRRTNDWRGHQLRPVGMGRLQQYGTVTKQA